MVWCLWQARSRYSLILLALFGILETASESPDHEQGLGSIDCPHSLTVNWNNITARPPYVVNSTGDFDGLLPTFLGIMLTECCRLSSNLVYNGSAAESDFHLPVIINLEADFKMTGRRHFVPMLPQTGIAFVVVKSTKSEQSWRVVKSLLSTWPVLVLILIFSLLAGIIAWSLETKKNPDNFPSMFTKGIWEGFWWAFISMTTVGYGDRYPRSIGGRLFAVMWILVGMVIISIFTAALTTSLTTLSLETKVKLPGAKVVALVDSIETITGFQQQVNLTRVLTGRDIYEHLQSGQVQGALMDAYFWIHFKSNYPTSNLKVQEVIQQKKFEYGVRVNNNPALAECFREKRYTQESDFYEHAEVLLQQSLSSEFENKDDSGANLFDPDGLLYFPVFFTCLGVTAFLMMIGGAWDVYRRFNCLGSRRGRLDVLSISLTKTNLDKYSKSQDKLQDLENRIEELNQTFYDLIKNSKHGRISTRDYKETHYTV